MSESSVRGPDSKETIESIFTEALSTRRPSLHWTYSQETTRRPSLFVPIEGTEFGLAEFRPFRHAHVIKRPRPLQYSITQQSISTQAGKLTQAVPATVLDGIGEERSRDNLFKQLGRLELFIDLVWVGIISSISHTFSKKAFTNDGISIWTALLEFVLLFVPLWRIWDYLRSFGSNFYNDGILQRFFMCWILFLAVVYGMNAPFAFTRPEQGNSFTLLVGTYLVARASFLLAHLMQCAFMPFLWRQFAVTLGLAVVSAALWVPTIWIPYPAKIPVLFVANIVDQLIDVFLYSPRGNKLITGGWKKVVNVEHYITRHEGFFILIVGDGVSKLITSSHSGLGVNSLVGTALNLLLIYYLIHWLYFDGDQTQEYVHALRCKFWKAVLWQTSHLVFFAALLLCAASNFHIVKNFDNPLLSPADTTTETADHIDYNRHLRYAFWTSSTCMAITLVSMIFIALLNKPLDKPKTLVVNTRCMRLAPRLLAIAIIFCLPLFEGIDGAKYFGAQLVVLYSTFMWEWFTGLEKDWKWIEGEDE